MDKKEIFQGMNYAYEVYKEMSFSKAAKKMYISQPSLSNAVKRIERQLGAPIFDRSKSPIGLTDVGKEYIKSVEIIMNVQSEFEMNCLERNELKTGNLTIGGSTLFTSYVLPAFISEYKEKYPQININLIESNSSNLKQSLLEGNMDILIDNNSDFDADIFGKKVCKRECLLLVVPKNFKINSKIKEYSFSGKDIINGKHTESNAKNVPLKMFAKEKFLLLPEGNDTRDRANKLFEEANIKPNILLEPQQQITAYNLSCNDLGISFVGDTVIKQQINDKVLYYKLNEEHSLRDICAYYKKNKYMSKACEEFLKIM